MLITPHGLQEIAMLQGYQGYAWSVVISRATGRMTLNVSDADTGFVLVNACTAIW